MSRDWHHFPSLQLSSLPDCRSKEEGCEKQPETSQCRGSGPKGLCTSPTRTPPPGPPCHTPAPEQAKPGLRPAPGWSQEEPSEPGPRNTEPGGARPRPSPQPAAPPESGNGPSRGGRAEKSLQGVPRTSLPRTASAGRRGASTRSPRRGGVRTHPRLRRAMAGPGGGGGTFLSRAVGAR